MSEEPRRNEPTPRGLHDGSIVILNVRLPFENNEQAKKSWTVECTRGQVSKISPFNESDYHSPTEEVGPGLLKTHHKGLSINGNGGLMLPSFCHSHIHLDKCFILDRCGDLMTGDFTEAMRVTNIAKKDFPKQLQDLYRRGAKVIRESVEHGVTAMRAHVEIDASVGFACLEVAQKLQDDYCVQCDIQIAIFAQEPLFGSSDHQLPGENFILLQEAATRDGINVVGSAPYVEASIDKAKKNIGLIFDIADAQSIGHIDFHLDYNLDPNSEPLVYEVIAQVRKRYGDGISSIHNGSDDAARPLPNNDSDSPKRCPSITIGHATRLQLFSPDEWRALAAVISDIPITFVGLPQSDIYMQGRAFKDEPLGAPRGTLRVPHIAREYGVQVAMSVNNVENAFTPQGSLDPLSLCTFGVGVFQAATSQDIRTLVRAVTLTSKLAIGQKEVPIDLLPCIGNQANFVILGGRESLKNAVLDPPFERATIKDGKVVAYKRIVTWFSS